MNGELKELMTHILFIEKILCDNFSIDDKTENELIKIFRNIVNKKWD